TEIDFSVRRVGGSGGPQRCANLAAGRFPGLRRPALICPVRAGDWLMRGVTFYQLHLLRGKHAREELTPVDTIAEPGQIQASVLAEHRVDTPLVYTPDGHPG